MNSYEYTVLERVINKIMFVLGKWYTKFSKEPWNYNVSLEYTIVGYYYLQGLCAEISFLSLIKTIERGSIVMQHEHGNDIW